MVPGRLLRDSGCGMVSPAAGPALPISNNHLRHLNASGMSGHHPQLPFQSGRATLLGPGRGIGRPSAATGSIDIPHLSVLESPVFLPIGPVRHARQTACCVRHATAARHTLNKT